MYCFPIDCYIHPKNVKMYLNILLFSFFILQ